MLALAKTDMKWPGLFQLTARVVTFPVALLLGAFALVWVILSEGTGWWVERFR